MRLAMPAAMPAAVTAAVTAAVLGSLALGLLAAALPQDGTRAAGLAEGVDRTSFRWGTTKNGGYVLVATFHLTPGWHSYWQNPGDAGGDAPRFELALPPGWQAGPTIYPRPDVKMIDGSPFYGYEGRATYLIPVTKINSLSEDSWSNPPAGSGSGQPTGWKLDARVMACQNRCTVSKAQAKGDWPPVTEEGQIDLNGGSVAGRSLPLTAAKSGVFAKLEVGKVTIDVPGSLGGTAAFIPSAIPGLQIQLPEGQASFQGSPGSNGPRITFRPEALGSGPGEPAVAGLILLGSGAGDPCVWLSIPHPLAGPGGSLGANGVGSSPDAPPAP